MVKKYGKEVKVIRYTNKTTGETYAPVATNLGKGVTGYSSPNVSISGSKGKISSVSVKKDVPAPAQDQPPLIYEDTGSKTRVLSPFEAAAVTQARGGMTTAGGSAVYVPANTPNTPPPSYPRREFVNKDFREGYPALAASYDARVYESLNKPGDSILRRAAERQAFQEKTRGDAQAKIDQATTRQALAQAQQDYKSVEKARLSNIKPAYGDDKSKNVFKKAAGVASVAFQKAGGATEALLKEAEEKARFKAEKNPANLDAKAGALFFSGARGLVKGGVTQIGESKTQALFVAGAGVVGAAVGAASQAGFFSKIGGGAVINKLAPTIKYGVIAQPAPGTISATTPTPYEIGWTAGSVAAVAGSFAIGGNVGGGAVGVVQEAKAAAATTKLQGKALTTQGARGLSDYDVIGWEVKGARVNTISQPTPGKGQVTLQNTRLELSPTTINVKKAAADIIKVDYEIKGAGVLQQKAGFGREITRSNAAIYDIKGAGVVTPDVFNKAILSPRAGATTISIKPGTGEAGVFSVSQARLKATGLKTSVPPPTRPPAAQQSISAPASKPELPGLKPINTKNPDIFAAEITGYPQITYKYGGGVVVWDYKPAPLIVVEKIRPPSPSTITTTTTASAGGAGQATISVLLPPTTKTTTTTLPLTTAAQVTARPAAAESVFYAPTNRPAFQEARTTTRDLSRGVFESINQLGRRARITPGFSINPATGQATAGGVDLATGTTTNTATTTTQGIFSSSATAQGQASATSSATAQGQASAATSIFNTLRTPFLRTTTTARTTPKPPAFPVFSRLAAREGGTLGGAFRAFARVKGRFSWVGKATSTPGAAAKEGLKFVETTPARTFGVAKTNNPFKGISAGISTPGTYKKKEDKTGGTLFIEPSKAAINTPGELFGISYKGARKTRGRQLWG